MEGARPEPQWLVACLCAQWCGTCRDYRGIFERQGAVQAAHARFVWVDVEDEADALDGVDVENFPTLLIAHGDRVAFFGTVTPQEPTLARLVENALGGAAHPVDDPEVAALAARIRALASRA